MKKWKTIRTITLSIIIVFLIITIVYAIICMTADVKYPYPALGTEVTNWFDRFCLEMYFMLFMFGMPLLADIILFIFSAITIRKLKKQQQD